MRLFGEELNIAESAGNTTHSHIQRDKDMRGLCAVLSLFDREFDCFVGKYSK